MGAKLDLSLYYFRAPVEDAPDFGAFYGADDSGRWELHFEGPDELSRQFETLLQAVREVATEARHSASRASDRSTAVWLKSIGTQEAPVDDKWWKAPGRRYGMTFPQRPGSIEPGDVLVVYAAGSGRIVGVLRVTSPARWEGATERYPWRMDTEVLAAVPVSEGEPLDVLSTERQIGRSIRQKSHIRLSEGEAASALDAFAVRP